ncbi:hypothetical protein H310_09338 [Aphanomyces invadans]|uniref:EF-hand domain-containing protein n=1 Tax=Aphanomyces invadans TaxID=157072 RepID=A0A024TV44_9STRA|nr:hypothetical protein H310_09338 [Aphanomyces invadans]ETV98045.1 hypothetical protein H310_09338 [Aphanomyces invadans]RHY27941.1 hypothetical protein DYB32_006413 [Aphanomyces invadans]|eukprot:XP_008873606.1 hypothetical protein H310_09338 [Aphanomyces invadans]
MAAVDGALRHLAGGWTEKNSLFRVGDNISEWLVMLLMFLVVLGVILFEQVWHWLGHKLHPYPKYHEMMHKITSELMILGMLGLFVHLFSEAYWIDFYSKPVKAFKIADQTIFFVACFLILQALLIFYVMRQKNIMTDQIELVSSHYVYQKAKAALNKDNYANWFQYEAKKTRALRVMRHKILRRFFLKTYNLPEMFQFSWYLRMQQDSQIQHLIDIELTQWMLLLLVWCGFIAAHSSIEQNLVTYDDDEQPKYVRVYVFMAFESLLSIVMLLMWLYINKCMNTIYKYLGIYKNKEVLPKMRECAEEERHTRESQEDSIAQLQRLHYNMDMHAHGHQFFLAADQGVQILGLVFRKCFPRKTKSPQDVHLAHGGGHGGEEPLVSPRHRHGTNGGRHGDHGGPGGDGGHDGHHPHASVKTLSELTPIQLPWFSRKLLHYFLKTFLMLNGLFAAIAMNSVVYILPDVPDMDYTVLLVLIASPLLLNAFYLGPRLMLRFMTLSTLWQLNPDNVSVMVGQYLSTIEIKTHMVESIQAFLDRKDQTVDDLRDDLEKNGGTKDFIDIETFRVVLAHYGFHVSVFKFNAMIRLVFKTKGAMVNYEQLLALLAGDIDVRIDQTVDMAMMTERNKYSVDDFDFTLDEEDDGMEKKTKALGSVAVDIGIRPVLEPIGVPAVPNDDANFATPSADGDLIHGPVYSEQR